jgi:hypothetical protein
MHITLVVCKKCGKTAEYQQAKKAGWLIASRKGKPGDTVIRCPEHLTGYASRQAGVSIDRKKYRQYKSCWADHENIIETTRKAG